MFGWYGDFRWKRDTERVRRALGIPKDWGVIGQIATRLDRSHLNTVAFLVADALTWRAGPQKRAEEERNVLHEEERASWLGPITDSPWILFNYLCQEGGGELCLQEREGVLTHSWRRPDGTVGALRAWSDFWPLSGQRAEVYLSRMRMLTDAELLDQDAPAHGSTRFRVPGRWFNVAATVLPQGRHDGLRAIVSATPEDPTPAPHDPAPVSRGAAEHYTWGGEGAPVCDGWRLMSAPGLSVIQERMPPGGSEERHSHAVTRQFFYVLVGTLTVEVDGTTHTLTVGQGFEVPPGAAHQVRNDCDAKDAEFLTVSNPGNSRADRIPEPA